MFEALVEIGHVYPGQLGGAIFKGIPLGERKSISFKASYKTLFNNPKPGEYWAISGLEVSSVKYGRVINVGSAFIRPIPSSKVIGRLLKTHPAFRGFYLGDFKIDALITEIGEFALVDILNRGNYLALADVISEPIAKKTIEAWQNLKDTTETATFLVENNFDSRLAARVMRMCRYNTVERLKSNPYSLIALSTLKRSEFNLIDKLGEKLNIPKDHPSRCIGVCEFVLYRYLEKGHTSIHIDKLSEEIASLKVSKLPNGIECIKAALKQKAICIYEEEKSIYIQTIGVAFIEQSVESKLKKLSETPIQTSLFGQASGILVSTLTDYNRQHKIQHGYALTDKQQAAVLMGLENRLSILTGFGGTGKTSIIRTIVQIGEQVGRTTYVAALAGKAKERAREVIGRETFTIHGLISELKKDASHRIDKHSDPLIIIDEASMVDISLINNLLRAIDNIPCSLMLIGDTAQLPPVGFGIFWHELAKSKTLASTHLDEVHRQASESPLHQVAMDIRNGNQHKLNTWNGESEGVFFLPIEDDYNKTLIKLCRDADNKILTPFQSQRFAISTTKLNRMLQMAINLNEDGMLLGGLVIKAGDPVIATKNNYGLEIFNGMVGVVIDFGFSGGTQEQYCDIKFEGNATVQRLTKIDCLEVGIQLAYAITIHKAQGSEYNRCVVVIDDQGYMERSMLYTALTRSKKLCLILGNQNSYDAATTNPPRIDTINYGFRWGG